MDPKIYGKPPTAPQAEVPASSSATPEVGPAGSPAGFGFEYALAHLKGGARLARSGWNGKGMFIFLVPGSRFTVNRPPLLGIYPEGTPIEYHAHIDMKTAQGYVVPWLCSQADMLAADWEVVGSGQGFGQRLASP